MVLNTLLCLALCIGAVFFVPLNLTAQSFDTTPPRLLSLEINPTSVDVQAGDQTFRVRVAITDDLAGLNYCYIQFQSPSGRQMRDGFASFVSGTPTSGVLEATITIPRWSESGIWKPHVVILGDAAGNFGWYYTDQLDSLGPNVRLNVISEHDITPPRITRVLLSPGTLSVTGGPQPLTLFLDLVDEQSRPDMIGSPPFWGMVLRSPTGLQRQYIGNRDDGIYICADVPVLGQCSWTVRHNMPQHSEPGIWEIETLTVRDRAGNQRTFNTAQLAAIGFARSVRLISATPDTRPPVLRDVWFTPEVFDTSAREQVVVVNVAAEDDLAGADFSPDTPYLSLWVGMQFVSPSGTQVRPIWVHEQSFNLVSGNLRNGVWSTPLTFPRYSEGGTWKLREVFLKDRAGNRISFGTDDLVRMGIRTDLVIFRPSGVPDGVLGPTGGTIADSIFGGSASLTVPGNAFSTNTNVAIDVLTSFVGVPAPRGFSFGSYFVNIDLEPGPVMPFAPPGLRLVLPLRAFHVPGTSMQLFRLDSTLGAIVPAVSVSGANVMGRVRADGHSAIFEGVARLSTVVGVVSGAVVLGDVNGDGRVTCSDLTIIRASLGKSPGQPGFDARADVNGNGRVDVIDLAIASRQLPAGTDCISASLANP